MPALEVPLATRPVLGHVNLMVDSFIANAEIDDMRAVVRAVLATSPPEVTAAFTAAARRRLDKMNARHLPPAARLFSRGADGRAAPTAELRGVLARARAMYGSGMGFASLALLTEVVRATGGARWDADGETAEALAAVDADITQGIQSAKEELAGGRVAEPDAARATVGALQGALAHCAREAEHWGGEFPFERAVVSIQYWKF